MTLTIHGNFAEKEVFLLSLNGESKSLDFYNKDVLFQVEKSGEYFVEFEQVARKQNRVLGWLIYLFTVLIQGIFNIILMNVDSDWHQNVKPYSVKGKFSVFVDGDKTICLDYCSSRYMEPRHTWGKPELSISEVEHLDVVYIKEEENIKVQYGCYVKRIFSVFCVGLAVFAALFCLSVKNTAATASVLLLIVMILTLVILCILLVSQHRKMRKLYRGFCNGTD